MVVSATLNAQGEADPQIIYWPPMRIQPAQ